MLGNHGRSLVRKVFHTPAKLLFKWGVTPNQVTVVGTVLSVLSAVLLLASGHLIVGGIVIGLILFADSLDGTLARLSGKTSKFGAVLDSAMDRIADGAVFASLTYWAQAGYPAGAFRTVSIAFGLAAMIGAAAVPYVRARGEGLGVVAKVGIAERTDRLVVALVLAGFSQIFSLPMLFPMGLAIVAFTSFFTVFQRLRFIAKNLAEPE